MESISELTKRLQQLVERQKELREKFDNEGVTRKENREMQDNKKEIEEIVNQLKALKSDEEIRNAIKELKKMLVKDSLTVEEKTQIDALATTINNALIKKADIAKVTDAESLNKKRKDLQKLQREYNKSKAEYETLELDATEVDNVLNRISKLLTEISELEKKLLDSDNIIDRFESKNKEKINDLITQLNEYEKELGLVEDEILDAEFTEEEEEKNKKSLKDRTKDKLKTIGEFFKKHKKSIIVIGSTIVLTVVLVNTLKSCEKRNENKQPDNTKPSTGMETTGENLSREKIDALINKGYDEFTATSMVKNFDDRTIERLINVPYIEAVSKYASIKEFNLDYMDDYDNAYSRFNLTPDKAVDYVNRAYEISKTNFYEDATINEIVAVVMAIDEKDLFTQYNANLAQSFNTSFNEITNNYLFGTLEESDINKLDALKYFAKEGSDLDNFLTNFAQLSKAILTNPDNETAKDDMYKYINIFAKSLNGFTNEESTLTDSEVFNQNAQVQDYYDWYMAYCSFIAPLYPTFNGKDVEVHGYIDENGNEILESENERYMGYLELQELMLKALEGPEFEAICGQSQKLN